MSELETRQRILQQKKQKLERLKAFLSKVKKLENKAFGLQEDREADSILLSLQTIDE